MFIQDESSSQLPEQGELGEDEIILNHLKSTKGVLTYPVLRPDMKPEERKLWERRFALPNHPKVLIFPATKVSSSSSSMKKTMGRNENIQSSSYVLCINYACTLN